MRETISSDAESHLGTLLDEQFFFNSVSYLFSFSDFHSVKFAKLTHVRRVAIWQCAFHSRLTHCQWPTDGFDYTTGYEISALPAL